ncbi:MAG: hypothetical protein EOO75_01925 [Myxococcales bacterium]|nr:MAG: hypothetical protein EOO75_01925 [Myxococcales bacterium]
MTSDTVPCFSGTSVLDLLTSYRELVGPATVERALGKLPEPMSRRLGELTAMSWLPVADVTFLVDTISAEAGVETESTLDDAVRAATRRSFRTVWRVLLHFVSDEALITRTPLIYTRSRNVGALAARIVAPGHAELTLTRCPSSSDRHLRTLAVGICEVLALVGRREPVITLRRTIDGAVYTVRWRV